MPRNAPCKGCNARTKGCHTRCKEYQEFKTELQTVQQKQYINQLLDDIESDRIRRNRMIHLKGGYDL